MPAGRFCTARPASVCPATRGTTICRSAAVNVLLDLDSAAISSATNTRRIREAARFVCTSLPVGVYVQHAALGVQLVSPISVEAVTLPRNRQAQRNLDPVTIGEVGLRPDQFEAFVDGRGVGLTRRDYELAELLFRAGGDVLPRERIYESLWAGRWVAMSARSTCSCTNYAASCGALPPAGSI